MGELNNPSYLSVPETVTPEVHNSIEDLKRTSKKIVLDTCTFSVDKMTIFDKVVSTTRVEDGNMDRLFDLVGL